MINVSAVRRIAIGSWAAMDSDTLPLLLTELAENTVNQGYERGEQLP